MTVSSLFELKARLPNGSDYDFADLKGKAKAILIFNSASKCGLTPQLEGLEALHKKYKDQGLVVVGFPSNQFASQEPGTDEEIASFCQLKCKCDVNGSETTPVFKYLKSEKAGLLGMERVCTFAKFLVDADGKVVQRYAPTTKPESIIPDIEKLLAK